LVGVLPVAYLDPALPALRSGAAAANAEQLFAVYNRKLAVTSGAGAYTRPLFSSTSRF